MKLDRKIDCKSDDNIKFAKVMNVAWEVKSMAREHVTREVDGESLSLYACEPVCVIMRECLMIIPYIMKCNGHS